MVAEEVVVTLSGGAPWGFRLQGGTEHRKPLQVAKVRKRSKACRAGLREGDELVSINENHCTMLSHAQAMNLIDSCLETLRIAIKRSEPPAGLQSVVLLNRAPSPRIDREYRVALCALSPPGSGDIARGVLTSPTGLELLTSPPDSEAYYGETDSDVDMVSDTQRRHKRRSPNCIITPEGNGYESTGRRENAPGVARREVVYRPLEGTENGIEDSCTSADEQGPLDKPGIHEVDSGFQEPPSLPPLVSPDRAMEALSLTSGSQLVPMVGPVEKPVDEELTTTYKDKARQAKLHRGESVQEKQVKEARSKCRTIASLLTDAPNPHSKGVLMFKKRRQRAKKYTLTCFGSVNGDLQRSTDEEEEEDGIFPCSESEIDEDGFTSAPDSAWDSDYLDVLERKTHGQDVEADSQVLSATTGKGAQLFEQQRKRAEKHANMAGVVPEQPFYPKELPTSTTHITPIIQVTPVTPITSMDLGLVNGEFGSTGVMGAASTCQELLTPTQTVELPSGSVQNRTARPFTPGFVSHRASTAPVIFRPNGAKNVVPQPMSEMAKAPPSSTSSASKGDVKRAVSVTSLYIPARSSTFNKPKNMFSAPPSGAAATSVAFSPTSTPAATFSPPTTSYCSPAMPSIPFSPPAKPSMPYSPPTMPASTFSTPATPCSPPTMPSISFSSPITPFSPSTISSTPFSTNASTYPSSLSSLIVNSSQSAQNVSCSPCNKVATTHLTPVTASQPKQQNPTAVPTEALASREQRISVPAARTGILQEARRRGSKKPMFKPPEEKKTSSPNPELLSLVQNLDGRCQDMSFESGAEEDLLNLGAEACNFMQAQRSKLQPPPVAPKPHVAPETPLVPQMGGKGAELFARRQSRMDKYVVDSAAAQPAHPMSPGEPRLPSPSPSLPAHWKYSPNIRAPPPINYNPLLSPSCPPTAQRGTKAAEAARARRKGDSPKQGIKAMDVLSHQPYQLNSSLFGYGSGVPQHQRGQAAGGTLTSPKQVPVKAARVYEVKRFSTPTPMSGPTLTPTTIAPRSATTLGEAFWHNDEGPVRTPCFSPPAPAQINISDLPELPKISAASILESAPNLTKGPTYAGFQGTKQFRSAPELSPAAVSTRAPRPNYSASRMGIQANIWRPGSKLC
ncbi:synaptopodin 2-like protein [Arapaima gigas]